MNSPAPRQVQQHLKITGRIRYTSKKPERLNEERGRESFTMIKHVDGKVTISAQCEIDEPGPTVLRDVVFSVNEAGRPMDCLLRLTVGDQFVGAGFFRMQDTFIECESYGPAIGRISQKVMIERDYDGFGSHPIICDGFNSRMDFSRGPHKRQGRTFLPSLDHRGATAPILAESRLFIEYLGDETVTVEAGVFSCRHMRITDEAGSMAGAHGAHPIYDVWVTADEDSLFVQGGVGGYMQTWYELVELNRPDGRPAS